jgi:hypothetical protein
MPQAAVVLSSTGQGEKKDTSMRIEAQSMEEPKRKLLELEEFIPATANEMVYDFGRFVSPYLNSQLIPQGFVRLCEAAIHDLKHALSGVTGMPIIGRLVGLSPGAYNLLHAEISNIADAIFPKEFASAVRDLVNTKVEDSHLT